MSTGYIYNGFGQYEERDGEKGICLFYAAYEFWLPYLTTVPIPNFTFHELDQEKSTPRATDEKGELVYVSLPVSGERIVEELCMKQLPTPNRDMGIMPIVGRPTGKMLRVFAGCDPDGRKMYTEVVEKEPTKAEREEAEDLARRYKEMKIQDYFQSKRERMTGGHGRLHPDPRTRAYMDELGVEDLDDVSRLSKGNGGMSPEAIKAMVESIFAGAQTNKEVLEESIAKVRRKEKAQFSSRTKHLNLAEHAKAYDEMMAKKAALEAEQEKVESE